MRKTLSLLAAVIFLASCDKDDNGGGGNSNTYQPTTAGSTWTYKSDNLLTSASTTYVVTATSKDTTAAGSTFRVFTNGSGSEYYRQSGTDYFQYGRLEGLGNPLELPYLKAGGSVGATWNIPVPLTVSGISVTVDAKFTIAQKGISHTVNGKSYSNVIVVDVFLTPPAIAPINSQKIKYYYAENVGRIDAEVEIVSTIANINIKNRTSLQSHTIVP